VPSTAVRVSPAASPTDSAALPATTPTTATPEPVDAYPYCEWVPSCTPRKGVPPMCTDADSCPATIVRATARASSIGMAYPLVPDASYLAPAEAATSTPTTVPAASTSGPPDCPDWMFASVPIRFDNVSALPPMASVAVIVWPSAVTTPSADVGSPPSPPALPTPTTSSQSSRESESPRVATGRSEAPSRSTTATSVVGSNPTTVAVYVSPVPTTVPVRDVAPSTTWWLVSTSPSALRTIPVPAAAPTP